MAFLDMEAEDQRIILECVSATAEGPFFEDYEFLALFGLDRISFQKVVTKIACGDVAEPIAGKIMGSSMLQLLYYPHQNEVSWNEWISVSKADLEVIYNRWCELLPKVEYKQFIVHGPVGIDGKFYRVVEYHTTNGVNGLTSQEWSGDVWKFAEHGPGCRKIMGARSVGIESLQAAGVDCSELKLNYNPHV